MRPLLTVIMGCLWLFSSPARADNNTLSVSATVLSTAWCWLGSLLGGAGTSSLAFGAINPASNTDVVAATTINFGCGGFLPVTFLIEQNGGSYKSGPGGMNRMRHTTTLTEYLPYSLTLNPTSATVTNWLFFGHTLTVTGRVAVHDFQNAAVGSYQDVVVISIIP